MTRIAFISDIHSNIDALLAVFAHIEKVGADVTLCLGDIVGYGPCPSECLHEIQNREIQCVLGNHDEYVTLLMDPRVEKLRPDIKQVVEWTQMQLSMDDLKWLSKLPMQMAADDFSILHSSFAPTRWSYCIDERTFLINFIHQPCQLAFCGHSHSPLLGMDMAPNEPQLDFYEKPKVIPTDRKVMVNVGSVGQPRDRNPKACVVFYEMETRQVRLDRVPYDTEKAKERFIAAKLPERFGQRICMGK